MRTYWNDAGVWVNPRKEGQTEMDYQMRNWYYFVWLGGDHIVEQHIHNLDVANWVLKGYPVKARGMGGRQVRTGKEFGEIYDHHAVEFFYENGATNFFAVHQDPETMAENVSQAFMSLSIGCAKCHNHPLEKWTNDQYYAFANMFARVRGKGWGGDARSGNGQRTVFVETRGDLLQPRTGRPQPPAPLDGTPLPVADPGDRREPLARWLTSPENPYFTKSIVNRVWANFFSVGLVEPVDDLRATNPASNEKLLAALCEYTAEHGYDLKALMRLILLSETYRRSSDPLPKNRDDRKWFARAYPRRLRCSAMPFPTSPAFATSSRSSP